MILVADGIYALLDEKTQRLVEITAIEDTLVLEPDSASLYQK